MRKSFAIIEVMVSMVVAAIIMLAFWASLLYAAKTNRANTTRLKATLYLREMVEVAGELSRTNWAEISKPACQTPLVCHPLPSGSFWILDNGAETIESGYNRTISTDIVLRNLSGEIDPLGFPDPNTKKVIASLIWDDGFGLRTATLETYVYKP